MELRELLPSGRELQLLLGLCSTLGLLLGSWSRPEVKVGGWPASLPVDSTSREVLHFPILIRTWQWQRQQHGQAVPAPGWIRRSCPWPPSWALFWGREQGKQQQQSRLALSLSLSLVFLPVFKSHYMGFCSFGTSSSFQICPGTSRAVTGMLKTRAVDCRDCTNERIQALLVSRGEG